MAGLILIVVFAGTARGIGGGLAPYIAGQLAEHDNIHLPFLGDRLRQDVNAPASVEPEAESPPRRPTAAAMTSKTSTIGRGPIGHR